MRIGRPFGAAWRLGAALLPDFRLPVVDPQHHVIGPELEGVSSLDARGWKLIQMGEPELFGFRKASNPPAWALPTPASRERKGREKAGASARYADCPGPPHDQ